MTMVLVTSQLMAMDVAMKDAAPSSPELLSEFHSRQHTDRSASGSEASETASPTSGGDEASSTASPCHEGTYFQTYRSNRYRRRAVFIWSSNRPTPWLLSISRYVTPDSGRAPPASSWPTIQTANARPGRAGPRRGLVGCRSAGRPRNQETTNCLLFTGTSSALLVT